MQSTLNDIDGSELSRELTIPRFPRVMLAGNRSNANIFAGITICISLMSASFACEEQADSVFFGNMPATRTSPGRILGANVFSFNTEGSCFVSNLELEACKGPAIDFSSEVFAFLNHTISDVGEVLQHNLSCSVFNCVRDQGFGSNMQEMFCYGCFVAPEPLKEAMSGTRANSLNFSASEAYASPMVIEDSSLVENGFAVLGVRCHEHALDSKIDTYDTAFSLDLRNVNFVCQDQVPDSVNEIYSGIFPAAVRDTSLELDEVAPNRGSFLAPVEVTFPNHGNSVGLKHSKFPTFQTQGCFIRGGNLFTSTASELALQLKLLPERGVMGLGNSVAVQVLGLEDNLGEPVHSQQVTSADIFEISTDNLEFGCSYGFHYTGIYYGIRTKSADCIHSPLRMGFV